MTNKTVKLGFMFFFTAQEQIPSKSKALYIILSVLFYAGFRRIDANQDILRSDRIVSGVRVIRLLAIQAGDDNQRDAGYGGIRQSDQFANHVSNNGMIPAIIRIIRTIRMYMKLCLIYMLTYLCRGVYYYIVL